MVESFENLDNILRDWVKENVEKCPVKVWMGEAGSEEESIFFALKKNTKKKYSSSLSRVGPNEAQNGSWN